MVEFVEINLNVSKFLWPWCCSGVLSGRQSVHGPKGFSSTDLIEGVSLHWGLGLPQGVGCRLLELPLVNSDGVVWLLLTVGVVENSD